MDLENILRPIEKTLCKQEDVVDLARPALDPDRFNDLEKNLWRGTVASIVYSGFRSAAVHELGAIPLYFDGVTFNEKQAPEVDFPRLYRALRRISKEVKKIKLAEARS